MPIKKSVTPNVIVCLEDGKKFKMLKRHLRTAHEITPDEYREKWGLKDDYPMVAPEYAKARSALAKKIGLGKKTKRGKAVAPSSMLIPRQYDQKRMPWIDYAIMVQNRHPMQGYPYQLKIFLTSRDRKHWLVPRSWLIVHRQ